MKIFFVTHSTTTDNEAGLVSGWNDTGLSETGIRQAQELGRRFETFSFASVYSSDLSRALATVKVAFDNRYPVIADRRLREIHYGNLTGQPEEVVLPMDARWIDHPFPNGESYRQAVLRVHEFLRELANQRDDGAVLIVGHRLTRFGLDTFTGRRTIEQCLQAEHAWRSYWEYEIQHSP